MWSLIRLEREHLTNTAGYHVVPLHFDVTPHTEAPSVEVAVPPEPERACCWGHCKLSVMSTALEIGGFVAVVLACYTISFATARAPAE
jgi:hypothetical protein